MNNIYIINDFQFDVIVYYIYLSNLDMGLSI